MKTKRIFKLMAMFAVIGIIVSLAYCKKDETTTPTTTTVTVHDTLKGKAIMGLVTYTDMAGATANAKGAVINLYAGTAATGSPAATTFADASGNYKFPYLLPGAYYITAKYNTDNVNYKTINGVNFATSTGYAVTMASADITQDITLANIAGGSLKIAMDTTVNHYKKVTLEGHSKVSFMGYHNENQQNLVGGFNVFKLTDFVFDETNPANTMIKGYVLLSSVNTLEPARDAVTGCVPRTLNLDTAKLSSTESVYVNKTADTAWYYVTPGKVEKYGNGYVAHGTLEAFYKHSGNETPEAPRVTPYSPDTALGFTGPFGKRLTKQIDMYFEYQGMEKQVKGANYNWMMQFEGKFTFDKAKDFYISSHSISDEMFVEVHVTMTGTTNIDY